LRLVSANRTGVRRYTYMSQSPRPRQLPDPKGGLIDPRTIRHDPVERWRQIAANGREFMVNAAYLKVLANELEHCYYTHGVNNKEMCYDLAQEYIVFMDKYAKFK